MAPPMCWQSTRSRWWSPSGGWPSWRPGWWTYWITQFILHQSTSALKRKCSSTFLGRSIISAVFSAGADAVERVNQSTFIYKLYLYFLSIGNEKDSVLGEDIALEVGLIEWCLRGRNYNLVDTVNIVNMYCTVGKSFYWRSMIMIEQPGSNKGKVKSEKQLLQKLPLTDRHKYKCC